MNTLAIDPGCTESAWLAYLDGKIGPFCKTDNETVLSLVQCCQERKCEMRQMKAAGSPYP